MSFSGTNLAKLLMAILPDTVVIIIGVAFGVASILVSMGRFRHRPTCLGTFVAFLWVLVSVLVGLSAASKTVSPTPHLFTTHSPTRIVKQSNPFLPPSALTQQSTIKHAGQEVSTVETGILCSSPKLLTKTITITATFYPPWCTQNPTSCPAGEAICKMKPGSFGRIRMTIPQSSPWTGGIPGGAGAYSADARKITGLSVFVGLACILFLLLLAALFRKRLLAARATRAVLARAALLLWDIPPEQLQVIVLGEVEYHLCVLHSVASVSTVRRFHGLPPYKDDVPTREGIWALCYLLGFKVRKSFTSVTHRAIKIATRSYSTGSSRSAIAMFEKLCTNQEAQEMTYDLLRVQTNHELIHGSCNFVRQAGDLPKKRRKSFYNLVLNEGLWKLVEGMSLPVGYQGGTGVFIQYGASSAVLLYKRDFVELKYTTTYNSHTNATLEVSSSDIELSGV